MNATVINLNYTSGWKWPVTARRSWNGWCNMCLYEHLFSKLKLGKSSAIDFLFKTLKIKAASCLYYSNILPTKVTYSEVNPKTDSCSTVQLPWFLQLSRVHSGRAGTIDLLSPELIFKYFPFLARPPCLNVDGHAMFGGDHVSGSCQVHQHRTQVRQRRRGADVQPVGQRRRVPKRTQPQAVAHGVTDVVCRHGDEKHPGQRAPGIFEAAEPHEETEGETEDRNEGGAVKRRALGEGEGGLEDTQTWSAHTEQHSQQANRILSPWVTGIPPCRSDPSRWWTPGGRPAAPRTGRSSSSARWPPPMTTVPPDRAWRCPEQPAATSGSGWPVSGWRGQPPHRRPPGPQTPGGRRSWTSAGAPGLSPPPRPGWGGSEGRSAAPPTEGRRTARSLT